MEKHYKKTVDKNKKKHKILLIIKFDKDEFKNLLTEFNNELPSNFN